MKLIMTHTICIFHLDVLTQKLESSFLQNLALKVYNERWKANLILIHSSPIQSLNYMKVKSNYIIYVEMSSKQTIYIYIYCYTAQTILNCLLILQIHGVFCSTQTTLTWPYLVQTATFALSRKKSKSDIHTGTRNCNLSGFTWNNYLL